MISRVFNKSDYVNTTNTQVPSSVFLIQLRFQIIRYEISFCSQKIQILHLQSPVCAKILSYHSPHEPTDSTITSPFLPSASASQQLDKFAHHVAIRSTNQVEFVTLKHILAHTQRNNDHRLVVTSQCPHNGVHQTYEDVVAGCRVQSGSQQFASRIHSGLGIHYAVHRPLQGDSILQHPAHHLQQIFAAIFTIAHFQNALQLAGQRFSWLVLQQMHAAVQHTANHQLGDHFTTG